MSDCKSFIVLLSLLDLMEFYVWIMFIFTIALNARISSAKQNQYCAPSSCGKLTNISYPFRLKQDSKNCGESRYELDCINNIAVVHLNSAEYHVEAINYKNYTIRLIDPDIQEANCSSMPRYFLFSSNFSDSNDDSYLIVRPYEYSENWGVYLFEPIIFLSCDDPVSDDASYVDTSPCLVDDSNTYAIVGDMDIAKWKPGCHVKTVSPTSWITPAILETMEGDSANNASTANNVSYLDIHKQLVYGFELSWMKIACDSQCGSRPCYFNSTIGNIQCYIDNNCYYINGGAHSCGKNISNRALF